MTVARTLPIDSRLDDVRQALREHARVLLVAEPGAGKTTRVPLALLDEPWCKKGKLLLLEPRRVAARLASRYMAEQLGESVGESVGYRVRGDSRVGSSTRLEVVTQGVLTRMLQDDPMLEGVAGIVFDEFHERSLEADLGLALALDVQAGLREDLRLVVMSATLDVGALRPALGETAPLIECPGRVFPVETRYRPLHSRGDSADQQAAVVREALTNGEGDLLVFLPGVAEIRRLARALTGLPATVVIHELHGRMTLDAQQRALCPDPDGHRRIVLATAIAESSVTVDGVRIVIDAGFERVPVFQPRTGMTRLATQRLNRASADQRRGRAGRQAPGHCYRLWAEEQPLPAHGEPEIVQADLSGLAFELARWGIKTPEELPWVTPPPSAALAAGRDLLKRLGILDAALSLTALGRACSRWPTHPRLAVMLERSEEWKATPLACWLTALLEGRDGSDERDLAVRLARRPDARARGAEGQWYRDARRLAQIAGCKLDIESLAPLGELLALAYPERVARQIEPGRFKLAGGGQAVLDAKLALAHVEALVAVDLDGQAREARIFRAAEVALPRIDTLFPETRHWQSRLEWSESEGRLQGEEVRALGELVLERRPLARLPEDAVRHALIQALRKRGRLPLDDDAEQLRGRVTLLRRELGDAWPDWSTQALLDSLETWLAPHLIGITRLDAVERLPMARLLLDTLEWSQRQALEELAPSHLQVPSGSRIRLDYRDEEPVLAVKLQELFGLRETPRLIGGRLSVVLHLLSPARRPLQVTRDLASFWANGYSQVRKDMRGRYPKHPWPEDPWNAPATSRTKHTRS
ncbi:ATP-dependent helicase HrpB [Litchfieldella qijiaojingensis]|uniref:ATP-dependent helicase HrpB n=1 Tax=Litchfieldella qijiaojingensis TaxID=980347 RepID=A0ABQ2YCI2_9GAMM|nr:ATP-dependent helicase HrpB [Halomonas qijiaojingensis]GGX79868.1 ATP-dependent helicase HrpB [Halomonas qijiaojingensis]